MGNFQKDRPDGLIRSGAQRPKSIQFVVQARAEIFREGGAYA